MRSSFCETTKLKFPTFHETHPSGSYLFRLLDIAIQVLFAISLKREGLIQFPTTPFPLSLNLATRLHRLASLQLDRPAQINPIVFIKLLEQTERW